MYFGSCLSNLCECILVHHYITYVDTNSGNNGFSFVVSFSWKMMFNALSLNRVGIVFCGRQSPGGHNVIWGLYNALKLHNPNSTLLGFLGKHLSCNLHFGF